MSTLNDKTASTPSLELFYETDTIDAFCRGKFYLVQPKKDAHKAGLDAMLLASCVPTDFKGNIADFGSGAGAAALAVLVRCKDTKAFLVENSPTMINYAKKTLSLKENYQLNMRATIIEADITKPGKERASSKLLDNYFDFIIMNPPYNNPTSNKSIYELRALAHVKTDNLFELWLKTAASCLKAKGKIALIAKSCSLNEILKAFGTRFGAITIYPIYPHKHADTLRLIFIAKKNSRASTIIKPPIYIRCKNNYEKLELTEQINKISNGLCSIYE